MTRLVRPSLLFALLFAFPRLARADDPPLDAYPLDDVPRTVEARGPMRCHEVPLVSYQGDVLRYHKPVRVYIEFQKRLRLFEEVVRATALEVYGRAPSRIVHAGTYNCRRISAYPTLLSEHGLGNGIDVVGFDFGPAQRRDPVARALRGSMQVRLGRHWQATQGAGAVHATFLRALAARLEARPDIFRVLLGPAYPGHKGHFHLDCAPYRMVVI
jgi:hypothetical protein